MMNKEELKKYRIEKFIYYYKNNLIEPILKNSILLLVKSYFNSPLKFFIWAAKYSIIRFLYYLDYKYNPKYKKMRKEDKENIKEIINNFNKLKKK